METDRARWCSGNALEGLAARPGRDTGHPEVVHGFTYFLQASISGRDRFLPYPYQFTIQQSSNHSTLQCMGS
jgi:hypothetical protein